MTWMKFTKTTFFGVALGAGLIFSARRACAADAAPVAPAAPPAGRASVPATNVAASAGPATTAANDPLKQLQTLIALINGKLQSGQRTEAALAEELKQFDTLLAAHAREKTDAVAQILAMKAQLYIQVFGNYEKALELMKKLKVDFPNSTQAKGADGTIAALEKAVTAQKLRDSLVIGAKFPDFKETDANGRPMSIAGYKGKVLLVDFWAAWCGPCMGELPNVLAAYEKHHRSGFDIVGISLDEDRQRFQTVIREKNMAWQQFFDGKKYDNKLAANYGVQSIPATWLLDREGVIVGKDLRGEELEKAVAAALGKK